MRDTDSVGLNLQVSYMILEKVSPVTHSVGNCVKRVVVIVSSVLFFQTPVSPINSLGKHSITLEVYTPIVFDSSFEHRHHSHFLCDQWHALVAGTGVALAGVFLYSRVRRIKPKGKIA